MSGLGAPFVRVASIQGVSRGRRPGGAVELWLRFLPRCLRRRMEADGRAESEWLLAQGCAPSRVEGVGFFLIGGFGKTEGQGTPGIADVGCPAHGLGVVKIGQGRRYPTTPGQPGPADAPDLADMGWSVRPLGERPSNGGEVPEWRGPDRRGPICLQALGTDPCKRRGGRLWCGPPSRKRFRPQFAANTSLSLRKGTAAMWSVDPRCSNRKRASAGFSGRAPTTR